MTKYRLKPSEIMQDLLDAGAIRPECVEKFKAKIGEAKKAENLNVGFCPLPSPFNHPSPRAR